MLVGPLPLVVLAFIFYYVTADVLTKSSLEDLEVIRDIKKNHIRDYFDNTRSDLQVISHDKGVSQEFQALNQAFYSGDEGLKETLCQEADRYFEKIITIQNWEDLFLINNEGSVIYSASRSDELGENLTHGRLSNMALGKLFKDVHDAQGEQRVMMSDFTSYELAQNEISGFVVSKMAEDEGYIALRLSLDQINSIMSDRSGMGKTASAYLVGPDSVMRSRVERTSENAHFFANHPHNMPLETQAAKDSLSGKTGIITQKVTDDSQVFAAYAPLDIEGLNWGIIIEMSAKEVLAVAGQLKSMMLIAAMVYIVGIIMLAAWIAKSITKPINKAVEVVHALSKGDLTKTVSAPGEDEISFLMRSINDTSDNLKIIITNISNNSRQLLKASEHLTGLSDRITENSHVMNQQAIVVASAGGQMQASVSIMENSSSEISQSSGNVASAIEEMSTSIDQVAKNCAQGSAIANQANEKAKTAQQVMNQLAESVNEISSTAEIISDIAEQTNLLALNANIEAASAGEAGKGFSVVANEVKDLAKKSAEAAKDISNRIQKMLSDAEITIKSFDEISSIIAEVCEITNHIALNVKEQSVTTNEIVRNMTGVSKATNELAANISQFASGSNQITENIDRIRAATELSIEEVQQGCISAQELRQMSEELTSIMQQFKLN